MPRLYRVDSRGRYSSYAANIASTERVLLHDDPSVFTSMSPEQMQQAIEKYMAWGQKLRKSGVLVTSDKLTDEPGRVIRG